MNRLAAFLVAFLALPLLPACPGSEPPPADDDDDDSPTPDPDAPPEYAGSACWGDGRRTQLFDHETFSFIDLDTSCRAEDEQVRVYVDDALWEDGEITQEDVDFYTWRVARRAPDSALDPTAGILANDVAVFGEPDWEAFDDGKVALFLVDTEGYGDGYLCSWCEGDEGRVLHVDGAVRPITDDATLSVTAHELVHLIEQNHDPDEEPWLSETLAEAAMVVNGYYTDEAWVEDWLQDPDLPWGPGNEDHADLHYGAALLLGTWIFEVWGEDALGEILRDEDAGWDSLLAAAPEDLGDSVEELWGAFALHAWRGAWTTFDYGVPEPQGSLGGGESLERSLDRWGVDYVELEDGGTLAFDADPAGQAWLLVSGGGLAGELVAAPGSVEVAGEDPVAVVIAFEDVQWTLEMQ